MSKINWKQKLTSRKFWAAIIGFVGALMTAFAVPTATSSQVTAIIMAFGTLIAYIIGEGLVDAAGAGNSTTSGTATGPVIGTVTDTAAKASDTTGTAQAEQTQQVTAGLGDASTK